MGYTFSSLPLIFIIHWNEACRVGNQSKPAAKPENIQYTNQYESDGAELLTAELQNYF